MEWTALRKLLLPCVWIALAANDTTAQHRGGFPQPPAPAVRDETVAPTPNPAARRLDTMTMEREARELAALASSIPADVEQLKKGLLPSEAVDKLKRIEKLSKQLRGQIRP